MAAGSRSSSTVFEGMAAVLLCCCLVIVISLPALVESGCRSPALIFNFGDSNSDTGGASASFGLLLPQQEGRVFFHRPAGRYCDGRLVVDFLCESLKTSYLSPYLESLGSDFRNGANFAIGGATTQPAPYMPFPLEIQVRQFLRFKARSLELIAQGGEGPVDLERFKNALYTIDIGQNDLSGAFSSNLGYNQVIAKIPSIIAEINKAVQSLYANGGKNFWIHNTGPLGCLPQKLALPREDSSTLDPFGCLIPYNNAAKEFNFQLSVLCEELNSELNATIVCTDVYAIKYDLIANYKSYGFESPLMACCGYGGPPYNFNESILCGAFGCQVCADSSKYISWDGVHYTEAANSLVAHKILTMNYSKPRLNFDFFCNI